MKLQEVTTILGFTIHPIQGHSELTIIQILVIVQGIVTNIRVLLFHLKTLSIAKIIWHQ
jgi:hypothetical protein